MPSRSQHSRSEKVTPERQGAPNLPPVALEEERLGELEDEARRTLERVLPPAEVAALWDDDALLDLLPAAAGSERLLDDGLLAAFGVVLGRRLVSRCKLEWVDDPQEQELGVRLPGSAVVFYPRRMVQAQLELARQQGRPAPRLAWLVASTRDYLRGLTRFYPSQPA